MQKYQVNIRFIQDTQTLVVEAPDVKLDEMNPGEVKALMEYIKIKTADLISSLPQETNIIEDKFEIEFSLGEKKFSTTDIPGAEKIKLKRKSAWSKLMMPLVIAMKFLGKALSVSAKLTKIVLAGTSFALYAYMFTWKFALVIMVQLFIHEYGHIWAMKRCGIKTKGIYFIPFFGGAAVASEAFKTRWDEVYVAMMGPVFGFMCAIASYAMWIYAGQAFYAAAASWMAMLNVINLIPINPLDGGRVMKSLMFSVKHNVGMIYMAVAIIAAFVIAFMYGWWTLVILGTLSFLELIIEWRFRNKENPTPSLSKTEMVKTAMIYVFMIVALAILMMIASANVPGAAMAEELLK